MPLFRDRDFKSDPSIVDSITSIFTIPNKSWDVVQLFSEFITLIKRSDF